MTLKSVPGSRLFIATFLHRTLAANFPYWCQSNPLANRDSAAAAKPSGNRADNAGISRTATVIVEAGQRLGRGLSGDL